MHDLYGKALILSLDYKDQIFSAWKARRSPRRRARVYRASSRWLHICRCLAGFGRCFVRFYRQ
jgi:hypothetical protein